MVREGDSDREWRRSIGQSDVTDVFPPDDVQADPPRAWGFAESNAAPVTMPSVPRHPLGDGERPTARSRRKAAAPDTASAEPPSAPRPFDERYVDDAKYGVASARASYRRMMRIFWALRFGVIASGLLVAVLSAASVPVWTIATFGALAAALEAVIATTNLQNRAVVRGLYADAVARELRTFSLRIDPYAGDDAVKVLHGKLEDLRSSASNTQFKLDQTVGGSGTGND